MSETVLCHFDTEAQSEDLICLNILKHRSAMLTPVHEALIKLKATN